MNQIVLYKYYSPATYNFAAVCQGEFFFSKANKLNDPFDVSPLLVEPYKSFIERCHIKEDAEKVLNNYSTCSFCEEANNKHLWALYAQSYSGFVIGYNKQKLENMSESLEVYCPLHKVQYLSKPFDLENAESQFSLSFKDEGKETIITYQVKDCELDIKKMDKLWEYLCITKEKQIWENEKEWRLFAGRYIIELGMGKGIKTHPNGYFIPIPEGTIKELIIGHNMSTEYHQCIFNIAKKYNIEHIQITQPTTENKEFEIKLVEFSPREHNG